MNLIKTKDGTLGIVFKSNEYDILLEVLNGFKPLTKESAEHLKQAKNAVLEAMGGHGNATIN